MSPEHSALPLVPILSVPRNARSGAQYLMSVDLRHELSSQDWPCGAEEVELTCIIDTLPLFSHRPLGATKIIVHRFGGSYGPVRFLLQACEGDASGSVGVLLVNEGGIPVHRIRIDGVIVRCDAEHGRPVSLPRAIQPVRRRNPVSNPSSARSKVEPTRPASPLTELTQNVVAPPRVSPAAAVTSRPGLKKKGGGAADSSRRREETLRAVQDKVRRGDYDGAIEEYRRLLELDPSDEPTLRHIADLQGQMGAYSDAVQTYEQAAATDITRGSPLAAIDMLKRAAGLIESSAPQLEDAHTRVLFKLAEAYTDVGQMVGALAVYDSLSHHFERLGQDEGAVEILRRMSSIDESDATTRLRLAEALVRLGRVDDAVDSYGQAAQLLNRKGQTDDAIQVLEGMLQLRRGLTPDASVQALPLLQQCVEAEHLDVALLSRVARSLVVSGWRAQAAEIYTEMMRITSEAGQEDLREHCLQLLRELAPVSDEVRELRSQGTTSEAAAMMNAPPEEPPSTRTPDERPGIRAAIDEAKFFSSRGLYEDASMILRERLEAYPGDVELSEAMAKLEPFLQWKVNRPDAEAVHTASTAEHVANDDAGENEPRATSGGSEEQPMAEAVDDLEQQVDKAQATIDVDEVFAKFKQGVKAQVSDSDSATHYDLGVAYKEMGLIADAAREFEIASRDPKHECNCLAMMGMMYRERGELDHAAECYVRGLNAQLKTVAQEVSLYYDLGHVYELKGDPDEAIYYFQRIMRVDQTYRDVSQRLEALLPRARRRSRPLSGVENDEADTDGDSGADFYRPKED